MDNGQETSPNAIQLIEIRSLKRSKLIWIIKH